MFSCWFAEGWRSTWWTGGCFRFCFLVFLFNDLVGLKAQERLLYESKMMVGLVSALAFAALRLEGVLVLEWLARVRPDSSSWCFDLSGVSVGLFGRVLAPELSAREAMPLDTRAAWVADDDALSREWREPILISSRGLRRWR